MKAAIKERYSRVTVDRYVERDLVGFPVELFYSVEKEVCPETGDTFFTIPNLPGLIAAACVARVLMPQKLCGKEIKSLRRALELTGKQLAEKLDVREETLSRWENDKEPMGSASEKLLRLQVGIAFKNTIGFEFKERSILDLQISPVRLPTDEVCVHLQLKHESIQKPDEGVWREPEEDKQAA